MNPDVDGSLHRSGNGRQVFTEMRCKRLLFEIAEVCPRKEEHYDTFFFLRLTRARAQPQAGKSLSPVCTVSNAAACASFFWLKSASPVLRAPCPLLTVLAGSITSWSTGVVGNCLIGLLTGFASQLARVPPCSAPVAPTREGTPRPEPGICGCRPCICGGTKRLSESVGRDCQ